MKKQLPPHATLALILTSTFLSVLIVAALSSCSPGEIETSTGNPHGGTKVFTGLGRVVRFIDEEAGIVCWVYGNYSIDCLPINQTRLDK